MKRTVIQIALMFVAVPSFATGCWHERGHDGAVYVEPRHQEVHHEVIVEHREDRHDDHPHY